MKIIPIKTEDRNKKRCIYDLLKRLDKEKGIKGFIVIVEKEDNTYDVGEANMTFGLIGALDYVKHTTLAEWDDE